MKQRREPGTLYDPLGPGECNVLELCVGFCFFLEVAVGCVKEKRAGIKTDGGTLAASRLELRAWAGIGAFAHIRIFVQHAIYCPNAFSFDIFEQCNVVNIIAMKVVQLYDIWLHAVDDSLDPPCRERVEPQYAE